MDLIEFQTKEMPRHPWETSRVKAVKKILARYIDKENLKVLDVGCGDCFAISELFKDRYSTHIDAIDINLTDEQAVTLAKKKGISVYNSYASLQKKFYDIIIAQDVIEHVEDDRAFLKEIIDQYAASSGLIFITVPAFNTLYSSHDSFLGHLRRYNLNELTDVLNKNNLHVMESGYLFFTLLMLRFIAVCLQRFTRINYENKGVGSWSHGKWFSKCIELALITDNCILFYLHWFTLNIPGLTVWALCKKQQ